MHASWPDPGGTSVQRIRQFVRSRLPMASDAEDVMQDILIRAAEGLGALKDPDRREAWFFRIARHTVTDHLRARDAIRLRLDRAAALRLTGRQARRTDPFRGLARAARVRLLGIGPGRP